MDTHVSLMMRGSMRPLVPGQTNEFERGWDSCVAVFAPKVERLERALVEANAKLEALNAQRS